VSKIDKSNEDSEDQIRKEITKGREKDKGEKKKK
jgi:hypothetical protein